LFKTAFTLGIDIAFAAHEGEENREEDEGVCRGPENKGNPDAEVVDLKNLCSRNELEERNDGIKGASKLTLLLVKANTPTPRIFVIVIPLITLFATLTIAVHALASRPRN